MDLARWIARLAGPAPLCESPRATTRRERVGLSVLVEFAGDPERPHRHSLDSFTQGNRDVVSHGHFRREFVTLAGEHAVLADLKRNLLAVVESLKTVFLLRHAGANEQTARQFQLHPQHDPEE